MSDKRLGSGLGVGHTGNSKLPAIQSRPIGDLGGMQPGTKAYQLGACLIFVSPPFMEYGWHLSISHRRRYPTWDEIAKARYELLPLDRDFCMVLPKPEEYVNIHQFCFQIHEWSGYANEGGAQ